MDHLVILGDFNAHHRLWEEARNTHLCTPPEALEAVQHVIKLMADHDLQMVLPRDKPTLQSTSSSNWTRLDKVLCTSHTHNSFTLCDVLHVLPHPLSIHVSHVQLPRH
jgi:hypothetical protein